MLADEEPAGNLIQGQGLSQVVPDIVQDGRHPQKVLVADGLAGGGGVEDRGDADQQVEQGNGLVDVAAEGAVVFVAPRGSKQLDNPDHLPVVISAGGTRRFQLGQVGLGVDSAVSAFRPICRI